MATGYFEGSPLGIVDRTQSVMGLVALSAFLVKLGFKEQIALFDWHERNIIYQLFYLYIVISVAMNESMCYGSVAALSARSVQPVCTPQCGRCRALQTLQDNAGCIFARVGVSTPPCKEKQGQSDFLQYSIENAPSGMTLVDPTGHMAF